MTVGTVETKFIAKIGMKLVPLKVSPKLELLFRPNYNNMKSSANPFSTNGGNLDNAKDREFESRKMNFFE
jgi:hypothetical protein